MKLFPSIWPKVTVAMGVAVTIGALIVFSLLLAIEYIWGNTYDGFIGHLVRAGVPTLFFATGILHFSTGFVKMREAHLKWYKQGNVLRGLELVILSLLAFLIFGQGYYVPANMLSSLFELICLFLVLAILFVSMV